MPNGRGNARSSGHPDATATRRAGGSRTGPMSATRDPATEVAALPGPAVVLQPVPVSEGHAGRAARPPVSPNCALRWADVLHLRFRHQAAEPRSRRNPDVPTLSQHDAVAAGTRVQAVHGVLRSRRALEAPLTRGVRYLRRDGRTLSRGARLVRRRDAVRRTPAGRHPARFSRGTYPGSGSCRRRIPTGRSGRIR